MGKHIKRRRRGWFFQLNIPAHLRHHYGGAQRIEKTLGTRDENLAEAKARQMAGDYKLEFMALEGNPSALEALKRSSYRDRRDSVLSRAIDIPDSPEDDPTAFGVELAVDKIINKPGRKYDRDGDPILDDAEQAEINGLVDGFRVLRGKKPRNRTQYEPPFSELADEWLESWQSSRDRRPSNTAAQYKSGIRVFGDYWGQRPIREVTGPDAAKFVELLKKLPANYGRGRLAGLTLQQSIAAAEGEPAGLASSTIKRHMIVLSQVWDWAKNHGHCSGENPFRIKLPKVKKQGYLHWEMQDLEKLFRNPPKRTDIVEVFYASLHTGMRLGELCELPWGRVREEDGVPFFLIEDAKTDAGWRKVPVHSKLRWILDKKRGADDELVWSSFTPEGPRKAGTGDASKLFGAWKRAVGFQSRRLNFHSARKNFVSQLQKRGVAQSDAALLVGHEVGFTFGTYGTEPPTLERLQGLVELVSYPEGVRLG